MLKRVQLMLDEELDKAVAAEARRRRTSRSEVVRSILRERLLPPLPPLEEDPLWEWFTEEGDKAVEPAHHDDVVYPR
jgi:hypothetical protein